MDLKQFVVEVNDFEKQIDELKESNRLEAESYASNSEGWKADIVELKHRVKELEARNEGLRGEMLMNTVPLEDYRKLRAENERLEIENWYYEVLELVQYDWWLEIIEDVSEVGKEELINIFKSAAKAAGRSENG